MEFGENNRLKSKISSQQYKAVEGRAGCRARQGGSKASMVRSDSPGQCRNITMMGYGTNQQGYNKLFTQVHIVDYPIRLYYTYSAKLLFQDFVHFSTLSLKNLPDSLQSAVELFYINDELNFKTL